MAWKMVWNRQHEECFLVGGKKFMLYGRCCRKRNDFLRWFEMLASSGRGFMMLKIKIVS